MTTAQPATGKPPQGTYRVHFRGGATFTTTAENSLQAEKKACKALPGIVSKIEIIRKASR